MSEKLLLSVWRDHMMIDGDGFFLVGNKDIAQNFQGNESDVTGLG